jgi:hypothetical protein
MLPLTPALQEWSVKVTQVPYHAVQWPEWYGHKMLSAGALACDSRTVPLTPAWTAELAAAGIAAADATVSMLAKPAITTVKIGRIGIMGS